MTLTFAKPERESDFQDTFSGPNAHPDLSPRELAALALGQSPVWFRTLFAARQKFARIAGLRTKTPEGKDPGVGFLLSLPVLRDDAKIYEAGLADRHLDFTIAVEKDGGRVSLTTENWFNNVSGRLYLVAVKPFHNRIVSRWVRVLGQPEPAQ